MTRVALSGKKNTSLKSCFSVCFALFLLLLCGKALGQTETLRISRSSFANGALDYGTEDNWTATSSGGDIISGKADIYSSNGQTTLQMRNSDAPHPYNSVALPGAITKITIKKASGTNRGWTPYLATSELTSSAGGVSQGSKTVSGTSTWTVDESDNYRYFYLSLAGGAFFADYIEIEYKKASCATPDALVFEIQPSAVAQNATMSSVKVKAVCSGTGATAASYSGNITLTLNAPGCGYTTQTVAAVNGIATFSNIKIVRSPQSNLKFTASANGFSAVISNTFNVTVPSVTPVVSTITQNNFDANTSWNYTIGTPVTVGSGGSSGSDVTGVSSVSGNNVLRKSYSANNGSGERGSTNTVTFDNVSGLSGYDQVEFSFQVFSYGSGSGGGNDKDEDFLLEVSTNNGADWSPVLTKKGYSNCTFGLSSSPVTSLNIATHAIYSTSACDTKSAFKLVLSGISQFRFRITATNNRSEENWAIDNVLFKGTTIPSGAAFNLPTVEAVDNFTVCNGESAQLDADVSSFQAPLSFLWTNASRLNDATLQNPLALPSGAAQTFTVTVTDAHGCKATDNVTVTNYGYGGTAGLWTGAEDDNWFNCRNWSDGKIPGITTDVIINQTAANPCRITDDPAECRSLSIISTNSTHPDLTIETTGSLIVAADVLINKTAGSGTSKLILKDLAEFSCRNLTIQGYSSGGGNAKLEHEFNTTTCTVLGNLTINPGGELDLSDGDDLTNDGMIYLHGNFNNQATASDFKQSTSTIVFAGTTDQTISTAGFNEVFADVRLEKPTGDVLLNNSIEVEKTTDFISGDFITGNNLFIFKDNSGYLGVSDASHINGNVRKIGNDAFTFPIGDGTYHRPAAITAPSNISDHFTAYYVFSDPHPVYNENQKDISLDHISSCEYWMINRTNGSSNVQVQLSWNANTSCGITALSDLRVARWNGSNWSDHGNVNVSGNLLEGAIWSNVITAFSPFTLASVTAANPLPIQLLSFQVACENNQKVAVSWSTATETNNERFLVEKSSDAANWELVQEIKGQGNSSELTEYEITDRKLMNEITYYRLTQVDFDGKQTIYNALSTVCEGTETMLIYPNPASSLINVEINNSISGGEISVSLVTTDGKVVGQHQLKAGSENILVTFDVQSLASGMYFIHLQDAEGIFRAEKVQVK